LGRHIEEVIDYWGGMITTSYDSTSGIITFEVEAFDPVSAERVTKLVLQYVQELVNRLSEKARQDSVRFAESEVVRSETRLRDALQELRVFREQEQSINPAASAQLQIELIGALETQLVDIRARMAALGESIDQDARPAPASRSPGSADSREDERPFQLISTNKSGCDAVRPAGRI
jgi:capsular polysaccharide transport system permease protein